MKLIKEKEQWWPEKVRTIKGYAGICEVCGTPVEYPEPLEVILAKEDDSAVYFLPLIKLRCPQCDVLITAIRIWKNLEISAELKTLVKQ